MEPRTHWEKAEKFHTVELEFVGNKVIHKDWWDPGHDPSRTAMTVTEFLGGKMHHEIERELGPRILANALETVERLASGGPGAAEPPDQGQSA